MPNLRTHEPISGLALNCPSGACATGYNTIAAGLTAADFLSFDAATDTFGAATPNFAGDPMEFGLTQIFKTDKSRQITVTSPSGVTTSGNLILSDEGNAAYEFALVFDIQDYAGSRLVLTPANCAIKRVDAPK
jgi:hypothetical protein